VQIEEEKKMNTITKEFTLECLEDVEFCIDDLECPSQVEYADTPIDLKFVLENNTVSSKRIFLREIQLEKDGKVFLRKDPGAHTLKSHKKDTYCVSFTLLEAGVKDAGTYNINLKAVLEVYGKGKESFPGEILERAVTIKALKGIGLYFPAEVYITPANKIEDADREIKINYSLQNNFDKKIKLSKVYLQVDDRTVAEEEANKEMDTEEKLEKAFLIIPSEKGIVHKKIYDCKIVVEYE